MVYKQSKNTTKKLNSLVTNFLLQHFTVFHFWSWFVAEQRDRWNSQRIFHYSYKQTHGNNYQ